MKKFSDMMDDYLLSSLDVLDLKSKVPMETRYNAYQKAKYALDQAWKTDENPLVKHL